MSNYTKVICLYGSTEKLVENINEYLFNRMILIYGRCTAILDGRI